MTLKKDAIFAIVLIGVSLLFTLMFIVPLKESHAQSTNNIWVLKPQLITTASQQDVCTLTGGPPCNQDVWLCYGDASTNSTATTITMADRQGTPVVRPNAVAIAANTWYIFPLSFQKSNENFCAWYPGGLKLTIGNANALSVTMSGRY